MTSQRPLPMIRRLRSCLLLSVCSWLAVGPLALLQLGAWSWMVVDYAREDGAARALAQTFSGERPCGMCRFIEAVETEDHPDDPQAPERSAELREIKLLLLSAGEPIATPASDRKIPRDGSVRMPETRISSVAVPPPRTTA